MNILFLCISFESGRDGVGDYTRQLAGELIRQGHQIAIVALNDKSLTDEWLGTQEANQVTIPILRVPATWTQKRRFERAKQWIDTLNPEWLSLQYVPFGFHNKGLPFGLGQSLELLGNGRKWHIMFHELWVGMDREASFKHIVWGWLQEKITCSIVKKLSPKVIHTHVQLYQRQLMRFDTVVTLLPLPSNIPLYKIGSADKPSSSTLSFVIFGAVHYGAPIKEFVNDVRAYSTSKGLTAHLVLIGRNSDEQKNWATEWQSQGLPVIITGELPSEKVSELLSKASFGITTTPIALIGKSSAVATMEAHSLPIICVSRSWQPRLPISLDIQSHVLNYQPGKLGSFLSLSHDTVFRCSVSDVVHQLITSLHSN